VAENAVSREEADTRAATLAQATAQVRAAEAELATARLQLDFTEVRAPITGRASRACSPWAIWPRPTRAC
jgi:multidrug efflux system membrane fusion protein